MKLLLDTHTLLWMLSDDPRLPGSVREILTTTEDIAWSVASLWEIGIKHSLERVDFRLAAGWESAIAMEMSLNGIRQIGIEPDHCGRVAALPWHHRDPFDRMLAAQAGAEARAMVSRDPVFEAYGVRRVW